MQIKLKLIDTKLMFNIKSKQPDSVFMGNHTVPEEINEISTNYILIRENHTIERLQLSTFISPLELQKALIWIENLSPWQSV